MNTDALTAQNDVSVTEGWEIIVSPPQQETRSLFSRGEETDAPRGGVTCRRLPLIYQEKQNINLVQPGILSPT